MFHDIKTWCLSHARELVTGILIFLVGTMCFALGYLYAKEANHAPIIIETVDRSAGQ